MIFQRRYKKNQENGQPVINNGSMFKKKLFYIVITVFLLIAFSGCNLGSAKAAKSNKGGRVNQGYRSVCFDGTNYLAVGTEGRIDQISADKTVTARKSGVDVCLNGVYSANGINVVVGDRGIILTAKSGDDFHKADSGVRKELNSVTLFHGEFLAAGAEGTLLHSKDGEKWTSVKTEIKNDIRSISANEKMCMAVTREGQILMSSNAQDWSILDYNQVYKGYDKTYWFHSIRACGDTFFLAGEYQENAGIPIIMSSDTGEVWRAHLLTQVNGADLEKVLPISINAIGINWDQLIAVGNSGKVLTLPECARCNKLTVLNERNINDMAASDGQMAVVGDGFWFDILKSDTFRQYSIKAEQAKTDRDNGAYIVDVRTPEEYASSHVKGALHIPVDKIETALETAVPDKSKELIFYCAKGVRAQQALEKALQLGYEKVYNLGGINDWPYEKEEGNKGSFSETAK